MAKKGKHKQSTAHNADIALKKKERAKKAELAESRRNRKKQNNLDDGRRLLEQLAQFGLGIRTMKADGNCMFRALSDQLVGGEEAHERMRGEVVDFMEGHPDDFSPFVENDEPWDAYVGRMRRDGTWAGNMELMAACRRYFVTAVVHQLGVPRFELPVPGATRSVHLSYHGGEHYNSVRALDDTGGGPAREVTGTAAAAAVGADEEGMGAAGKAVRVVVEATRCPSRAHAAKTLRECEGDVEAAVEVIVAEMAAGLILEEDAPRTGGTGGTGAATARRPAVKLSAKERRAVQRRRRLATESAAIRAEASGLQTGGGQGGSGGGGAGGRKQRHSARARQRAEARAAENQANAAPADPGSVKV